LVQLVSCSARGSANRGRREPLKAKRSAAEALQKKVEEVSVSPITHDIHVLFEGAYAIATFVSDPTDVESWHIRDNQTKQRVVGCAKGLRVTEVE